MKSRNYNIKQIAENQNVLQIYLYGEIELLEYLGRPRRIQDKR